MKNLHNIHIYPERLLANLWKLSQRYKIDRFQGDLYYEGHDALYPVWENDTYSAVTFKDWAKAGRPMPDLGVIRDISNLPMPIFKIPN